MIEKGKIILIIEDDASLTAVLKTKFSSLGYEVFTASDGERAVKALENTIPGVILLDIMLPKKSGLEILEWIRGQERLKKVSVVVISNLGKDKDIQNAMELGAKEYIVKANVTLAQIVEKVRAYVQ